MVREVTPKASATSATFQGLPRGPASHSSHDSPKNQGRQYAKYTVLHDTSLVPSHIKKSVLRDAAAPHNAMKKTAPNMEFEAGSITNWQ